VVCDEQKLIPKKSPTEIWFTKLPFKFQKNQTTIPKTFKQPFFSN